MIFTKTNAEERIKKAKARKEYILNPDSQLQKHPMKKDMPKPGNQTIGLPVIGLMIPGTPDAGWFCTKAHTAWILNLANHPTRFVLDLGCTRSIGSRTAIERFKKHACCYGITTEFCCCNKSFVFANSETETCKDSCIVHSPTIPPCSAKVDVLETGDVPILFSLSQMNNFCMTIELDPKGDKITCPAFRLSSSPAEHSTMGHIVLDLTHLAYQPTTKSREQSGHPKRRVTFAMSERKTAYPAHAPDMHEDEDEDDKPLVRPTTRRRPAEE